jgi:hypothetical protein
MESGTKSKLVGLDEVLSVLDDEGPLSTREFAQRLSLLEIDARLALVQAHSLGLVRTTGRGDWSLTADGREAIEVATRAEAIRRAKTRVRSRSRPAVTVALCALLGAASVAVGRSAPELFFEGPPSLPAQHHHIRHHAARGLHAEAIQDRLELRTTLHRRRIERATLVGTAASRLHLVQRHHRAKQHRSATPHRQQRHHQQRPGRKARHSQSSAARGAPYLG